MLYSQLTQFVFKSIVRKKTFSMYIAAGKKTENITLRKYITYQSLQPN